MSTITLRTAAVSDIGQLRTQNEDRYLQDDELRLYGVADGVGGLPSGAEAAQLAVEEVTRAVQALPPDEEPNLAAAVQCANQAVVELGRELSPDLGIGTTLTFGLVRDGKMHLAHVGDSRCYLWHDSALHLLTRDHSVESDARVRRARGEVVYYHEATRNALTRCIGQPVAPEADRLTRPLKAGDRYLFCSDGVTRLLDETDLVSLLGRANEPAEVAREIVAMANRCGGPDNATAVLVFVEEAP